MALCILSCKNDWQTMALHLQRLKIATCPQYDYNELNIEQMTFLQRLTSSFELNRQVKGPELTWIS